MRALFKTMALSLALTACSAPPVDRNASEPPHDNNPTNHLWASETSMVQAGPNSVSPAGRILLAYNDQRGVAKYDGNTIYRIDPYACGGKSCTFVGQSFAGLSYSDDRGKSWHRKGTFTPAVPDCAETYCPTVLFGDPWIAANGSDVLYINLAGIPAHGDLADLDHAINGIAYLWSHDGGVTWGTPKVAELELSQPLNATASVFVDKPSVSIASDGTALIAYWQNPTAGNGDGKVHIVTADSGNFDSWSLDDAIAGTVTTVIDPLTQAQTNPSPIIVAIDSTHAYLGFRSGIKSSSGVANVGYHVFRVVRDPSLQHWSLESSALDLDGIPLETSLPGGPVGKSRPWADALPGSFSVGGPQNNHLFVAYRYQFDFGNPVAGSKIAVLDCVDSPSARCALSGGTPWRTSTFKNLFDLEGQFQPNLTADRNDVVALTWYGTVSGAFTATGVFSSTGGQPGTWSTPSLYPSPPLVTPCPNAQANSSGISSIGEYTSSVIVPAVAFNGNPWIVSARTDWRGGCADQGLVTFDEHVQAVVW